MLDNPNLKANLEEFEIKSTDIGHMKHFIKMLREYGQFAKLSKVTFICDEFEEQDFKKLLENIGKYFRKFRSDGNLLICSDIIPAVHPQSSEEHKYE